MYFSSVHGAHVKCGDMTRNVVMVSMFSTFHLKVLSSVGYMFVISLLTMFHIPSLIVSLNVPHETDSYVNVCMAAMLFSVVENITFREAAFSHHAGT